MTSTVTQHKKSVFSFDAVQAGPTPAPKSAASDAGASAVCKLLQKATKTSSSSEIVALLQGAKVLTTNTALLKLIDLALKKAEAAAARYNEAEGIVDFYNNQMSGLDDFFLGQSKRKWALANDKWEQQNTKVRAGNQAIEGCHALVKVALEIVQ
jgi:hypothetical protein